MKRRKKFSLKPPHLIIALIVLFLVLNIISSQTVSPVYFGLSKGSKKDSVEFLKRTMQTPYFYTYFPEIQDYFQQNLNEDVFSETIGRKKEINQLKKLLILSPNNPKILYRLYVLYINEGDMQNAEKYLLMAQKVDPEIR